MQKVTATKAEQTHYFETEDGLLLLFITTGLRRSKTSPLHSSGNGGHSHQAVP